MDAPRRYLAFPFLFGIGLLVYLASDPVRGCCPAGPEGKPVLNADQTVIIIWDAATKMEHFIRKASFSSEADSFGFLIPSPTKPELDESGNEAFDVLRKLTEPEIKRVPVPEGVKKAAPKDAEKEPNRVKVLEEKVVGNFHAAILEADSADALVDWLKNHGYAYSPEVEEWAEPYIKDGWKITALKVAKDRDGKALQNVNASAFRMSFKTERPLFPYREPDNRSVADALKPDRLLRIYFIAEARYQGETTFERPWKGEVAWSGEVSAADRKTVLDHLKLPDTTGPARWWLTEFEDHWAYRLALADITFSRSGRQAKVRRDPITVFVDESRPLTETSGWVLMIVGILLAAAATGVMVGIGGPILLRKWREAQEAQDR
jgi:hypothetical protein